MTRRDLEDIQPSEMLLENSPPHGEIAAYVQLVRDRWPHTDFNRDSGAHVPSDYLPFLGLQRQYA